MILARVAVAIGALALALALTPPLSRNRSVQKPLCHPHRAQDPLDVERRLLLRLPDGSDGGSYTHVIGCDDSGSGSIAGPVVVAGCAILSLDRLASLQRSSSPFHLDRVDDSKRLSRAERDLIYEAVMTRPDIFLWSVAVRSSQQIDEAPSLLHATLSAVHESVDAIADRLPSGSKPYCIVDGHRTPSNLTFPCRPWPRGDATVYTVAIASVLARVVRDRAMEELGTTQFPQYGWHDENGGYPSVRHAHALHVHGLTPHHRRSCRPVFRARGTKMTTTTSPLQEKGARRETSRGNFLSRVGALSTAFLVGQATIVATLRHARAAHAMTIDSRTGIALPDVGEIESAVPTDWNGVDNPISSSGSSGSLGRLDSTSDAIFYQDPRFVEHVDEQAVRLLTEYVSSVAVQPSTESVLDLCSSWTSHLSSTASTSPQPRRVAGLGMNAQELRQNAALTEWVVQDLNQQPPLPYQDNSFDCVLCQLSIDYLTRPLQVCREVLRVLKPGGTVHILFSNRLFLSKAVALWTGADDVDHAFTVASYLHFCSGDGTVENSDQKTTKGGSRFGAIRAKDLSVRGRDGRIRGDPLYVVTAIKEVP
jgi:ribonuclease HII